MFKFNEEGVLKPVDISFVSDDHPFGWTKDGDKDVLHFEGTVEVSEIQEVD